MTAFYTKTKMSGEKTELAIQAFFSMYFDFFIGKHTDWLLLNEPDISKITPVLLNRKMKSLMKTYQREIAKPDLFKKTENKADFNQIVAEIAMDREHQPVKAK